MACQWPGAAIPFYSYVRLHFPRVKIVKGEEGQTPEAKKPAENGHPGLPQTDAGSKVSVRAGSPNMPGGQQNGSWPTFCQSFQPGSAQTGKAFITSAQDSSILTLVFNKLAHQPPFHSCLLGQIQQYKREREKY